jgi:hypothetical protein
VTELKEVEELVDSLIHCVWRQCEVLQVDGIDTDSVGLEIEQLLKWTQSDLLAL